MQSLRSSGAQDQCIRDAQRKKVTGGPQWTRSAACGAPVFADGLAVIGRMSFHGNAVLAKARGTPELATRGIFNEDINSQTLRA
jgi:hypothetical protein